MHTDNEFSNHINTAGKPLHTTHTRTRQNNTQTKRKRTTGAGRRDGGQHGAAGGRQHQDTRNYGAQGRKALFNEGEERCGGVNCGQWAFF
jgi:hypothetical protein